MNVMLPQPFLGLNSGAVGWCEPVPRRRRSLKCRLPRPCRLLGGMTTGFVERKRSLRTTGATVPKTIVATVQAEKTGPGWMTVAMAAADASPVRGTSLHGGMRRRGVRTVSRTRKRAMWCAGSATCRWAVAGIWVPIPLPDQQVPPSLRFLRARSSLAASASSRGERLGQVALWRLGVKNPCTATTGAARAAVQVTTTKRPKGIRNTHF